MQSKNNEGVLKIYLAEEIDSQNAASIQKEIFKIIQSQNAESLILDAKELNYISSAGLRAIIATQKEFGKKISVVNLSPDVMEIFKMAGFQYLMEISGNK